ncbi:MAG TPA: hypothetical protein VN682_21170 [Terriglobales bacterium]|nr:hypothetical protein [Terriglobales bacterium]
MQRTASSAAEKLFSTNELKASALASHKARKQLLRVPWDVFFKAYEEYPRWQGLSLWTRVAADSHEQVTEELLRTLRKHCPELVQTEEFVRKPHLMGFRILEWVHDNRFGYAKQRGWLDALTFYGVRHPHSRAVWADWEHRESERDWFLPNRSLPFDEWWRRALKRKIAGSFNCEDAGLAVGEYIDWEAMAMWLRPMVTASINLTSGVVSELKRTLRNRRWQSHAPSKRERNLNTSWLSAIHAGKKRCLKDVQKAGCIELFKELLKSDPLSIRLRAFARHCEESPSPNWLRNYPMFREWRLAAEQYISQS